MKKKYQIFVSSTYDDLRQEREAVSKAILELGDIPVGMEMFSAGDENQWKLIKRQIEQSDYYLVLVAHRYGSMIGEISYTEREYDYAADIGVPVLGFLIEPTAEWPPNFIDTDSDVRRRLENFKSKVTSRMVSFWTNPDSLNGKVLAALSKQKNLNPRPAWIRANNVPGPEVLAEVANLSKEVARLSEENSTLREKASLEAQFSLIDAMAEDSQCQALIFLHETGNDLPRWSTDVYGYHSGGGGSGQLTGFGADKMENAGLVRVGGGGRVWRLTEQGQKFAEWLLKKGRKSDFFWTPQGGWGKPQPGSPHEKWLNDLQSKQAAKPETPPPPSIN